MRHHGMIDMNIGFAVATAVPAKCGEHFLPSCVGRKLPRALICNKIVVAA